ncbi:MAG: type II secretion system protein [Phycisphaerales bacterium]|nr:type II secretion system protein [Phycisphaerales bacterium]
MRHRRAFSLVELLITVGLIIVVATLVIYVSSAARRTAQEANTQALMTSISQGLTQFKNDTGYYPPVLNDDRSLMPAFSNSGFDPFMSPSVDDDDYGDDRQQWYSETTLAEYLLGYGGYNQDGYGKYYLNGNNQLPVRPKENPPLGIRHPGPDGVWGAQRYGNGSLVDRDPDVNPSNLYRQQELSGRVLGPYITLSDERLVGMLTANGKVLFPGDPGYSDNGPKAIADYWGNAIRYYRTPYAGTDPGTKLHEAPGAEFTPSLSDVVVLRPQSIVGGQVIDSQVLDANGEGKALRQTRSADFALFSRGADQAVDEDRRVDEEEFNIDNLVEIGP